MRGNTPSLHCQVQSAVSQEVKSTLAGYSQPFLTAPIDYWDSEILHEQFLFSLGEFPGNIDFFNLTAHGLAPCLRSRWQQRLKGTLDLNSFIGWILMSLMQWSICRYGQCQSHTTQAGIFSVEEIPNSKNLLSAVLLALTGYFKWTSTIFPISVWFLEGTSTEHLKYYHILCSASGTL